jgi:hypothetical protein
MGASEKRTMSALSQAATQVHNDPVGYPHELERDLADDGGLRDDQR